MFIRKFHASLLAKIVLISGTAALFTLNFSYASSEDFFPNATSTEQNYAVSGADSTSTLDQASLHQIPRAGLIDEPLIRVGVGKTDKKVTFVSPFPYEAYAGDSDLGLVPGNEVVNLSYSAGVYKIVCDSLSATSSAYLKLVSDDSQNYFSIMSLDRHLISHSQLNFNAFRGSLEYRFGPISKMPFLINEVKLEDYVAGVAETGNNSPEEYIKALQIAARTYGYTNISRPITSKNLFDVYASTVDQLYLGYNFESFSPRIAKFTAETRGLMVTYKDKPVTTYYFSQSNGYTKTKKNTPWLKTVSAKYDKGKKMLGHGYGMSNHDASLRAGKDNWTFDQILTYYYSGTKIEKIY